MRPKRFSLLHCLLLLFSAGFLLPAQASDAAAHKLLAKYATLEHQLSHNQFMRPVVLDSLELAGRATGEIYVVSAYPFARVSSHLNSPTNWCDVISLLSNIKYCRAAETPATSVLKLYIGRKTPQNLSEANRMEFNYSSLALTPTYFSIQLNSGKGPYATRDYLIELEAVALPGNTTFLHLRYSITMGLLARVALKTYLATFGSGSVGFTITGTDRDGQPQYIGGVRGLAERNTLRYYLAIESFLTAAAGSPAEQLNQRLQIWVASVEQYPQLRELDRDQYLVMKHDEYLRQQKAD